MKSYPIEQCYLFRVGSKKRLAKRLRINLTELEELSRKPTFTTVVDNGKVFYPPVGKLRKIHDRIFDLIKYVETPSYLKSDKKGSSNVINASTHSPNHALVKTDIKNYFPSVKSERVYMFFRHKLQVTNSVARCLCNLLCKNDRLVKGSPVSGLLAFWSNIDMFNKIEHVCKESNSVLSVYVDDISGSTSYYNPNLLRRINGVIRQYGYDHHKHHVYKPNQEKIITGIVLAKGKYRPSKSTYLKMRGNNSHKSIMGAKSYEAYVDRFNS